MLCQPRFGHIKPAIQQRVAATRGVRQEDTKLTVGDLAQSAAVLPLHTDRMFAFLRETATVHLAEVGYNMESVGT